MFGMASTPARLSTPCATNERTQSAGMKANAADTHFTLLPNNDGHRPLRVEIGAVHQYSVVPDDGARVGSAEVQNQIGARVNIHVDGQVNRVAGFCMNGPVVLDVRRERGRGTG